MGVKTKKSLLHLLDTLNLAQKKAVETIEGPVMVVAGPGTGKTQTLSARIAHILQETDTPADGILALTFTDAGARQMRERLTSLIGRTAFYVNIYTFHSFCSEIIRTNPDVFTFAPQLEALSDLERISIFQSILDQGKSALGKGKRFDSLRPKGAPYLYVHSLVRAVSDLKREGITKDELEKILLKSLSGTRQEQKYHERNRELVHVYTNYQRELNSRGRYDFEDMINLVIDAFKTHPDMLLSYQQRYLYVLVDEYQDTNSAQHELLMLLMSYWGKQANIFVVGDDEQAIFRFQGASIENILTFKDVFPHAALISLTKNYRSTQTILDAARAVVSHNHLSLSSQLPLITKTLNAQTLFPATPIHIGRFSHGAIEHFFVAKKIQELIGKGISPYEIAVIYRNNSDSIDIAEMLSRMDIPFDLQGGSDVLTNPDIEKLFLLMRAVLEVRTRDEGVDLFTLLNYPFMGCDYVDVLKLTRFASDHKLSLWETIEQHELESMGLKNLPSIRRAFDLLAMLQQDESEGPFTVFFEKLMNKTGFLNWCLLSKDAINKLNAVNSLFSEIKRLNRADHTLNLQSFLQIVNVMRSQSVSISQRDLDVNNHAVTLITAHRAKGREFQAVFLIHAVDGRFGNNQTRELLKLPPNILSHTDVSKKEKNEDERRLFYVAMTRAKQLLFITSSKRYASAWGRKEESETMFVHEIPRSLVQEIGVGVYETSIKQILTSLLTPVSSDHTSIDEQAFLRQVLGNFKLSPTALNTYLACPYKFKLNNLLRAPRAKSNALSYGSAIHTALEWFFREFKKTRSMPSVEQLQKKFLQALEKEVVSQSQRKDLATRGKDVVKQYLQTYKDQLMVPIDVERYFGYGWSKTLLGTIPLAGKVDKIEPLGTPGVTDGDMKKVRVVDYKTGQPRSRGDIEGKTAQSTGDYKRQLVFYRLLSDLDRTFTYVVEEAELDFVEPDRQTGKLRKERFAITDEQVNELKAIIMKAWKSITQLEFPRTTDTQKHCVRCEWRLHCWPDGLPVRDEQLSLLAAVKEEKS